jgi:hypothetical protein
MQYFSPYEGANGCQAQWTSVFRWDGAKYVTADSSFPTFYKQRLSTLNAEIDQAKVGPNSSAPNFELDMSCDYMDRDRVERLLGIDPTAGLDWALTWASSAEPRLRERAVIVLSEIHNTVAMQALRQLTHDPDESLAQAAREALESLAPTGRS